MKQFILLVAFLKYCTDAFILSPDNVLSSQRVKPCFVGYDFETEDNVSNFDEDSSTISRQRFEYAAISPGTQVEVQVGNVDLARKAWKKRRRTGSPLLIPCSILNMDRKSMVMNNMIYLLQRFGKPIKEQENMVERPFGFKSTDISLSMPDLYRYYKSKLRSPLHKHVAALGYESSTECLKDFFDGEVEQDSGIKLYSIDEENQWLVSSMSKMRGQRLASQSSILQFLKNDDDDYSGTMKHTGMMRTLQTDSGRKSYDLNPLSAALRVSQRALDTGSICNGSRHNSLVVGLDPMGDGGSPLIKVSLNTFKKERKGRKKRIISPESNFQLKEMEHEFHELKAGDGPFYGKVVRLNKESKVAHIDIGVGRSAKANKGKKKGFVRVLGVLQYDDDSMIKDKQRLEKWKDDSVKKEMLNSIKYGEGGEVDVVEANEATLDFSNLNIDDLFAEEDTTSSPEITADFEEEVEEDISHLVTLENGVFSLHDPEGGSNTILGSLDDEDDDNAYDEEEDELFAGLSPEQRFEKLEEIYNKESLSSKKTVDDTKLSTKDDSINEGDEIKVYIQAVSKQSGQFTLSKNTEMPVLKEMKKEAKANKNLERLLARFGGSTKNILKWKGTVGEGTVKAISKTGNWLYVEPHFHDLPVGVAQLGDGISLESFSQGDLVQVRLDGIDNSRGQLSLTIVVNT